MRPVTGRCLFTFFAVAFMGNRTSFAQSPKREIISLNGIWQIAQGDMDHIPTRFDHTVPVPGLATLATPAFKAVGPKVKDRRSLAQSDTLREAFWYRREFMVKGPIPAVARLKIAKAKYGTKVFLNGRMIGEHLPCFTPGYFNVKGTLRTGRNELIVRVGASRDAVPDSIPDGLDFEKERYIPGIFDNVSLMLSGTPHIVQVQTVPDITDQQLQVQLALDNPDKLKTVPVTFTIREKRTGKVAGTLKETVKLTGTGRENIGVRIPVKNCHLWSPEAPFLYQLEVSTSGDQTVTTFGMREFHFDPLTGKAVLNGKPYFMRGSNITLYRFFEDSAAGHLPWDTAWVRKLFRSFKQFHWNSLRFCIGLPPEWWYRIADEEGFLIQDEFPIWYGGIGWNAWPPALTTGELTREYTQWMHEDWNHPSVVICDASNETVCTNGKTDETGEAVWRVRNLDLSNRPWDNSYSPHRAPGDVYESHPYHFQQADFELKDIAGGVVPAGNQYANTGNFPEIINEYGWLWLNRDGSPTTLTGKLYHNLLGDHSTARQRWHLYATYMAAETEYWRCHRKAAGVLIFTALGYSRADGQTSDFFTDPAKLAYDSAFLKYLPDAFSPVGLMLDEWGTVIGCGRPHDFSILTVNDLGRAWKGTVHLQILRDGKVMAERSTALSLSPYGNKTVVLRCPAPKKAGSYTLVAGLEQRGEKQVKSIREDIPFK
jgi:beta-galactosidase/beta-glucuronidase